MAKIKYSVFGTDCFSSDDFFVKDFDTEEEAKAYIKELNVEEKNSDIPNRYWMHEMTEDHEWRFVDGHRGQDSIVIRKKGEK